MTKYEVLKKIPRDGFLKVNLSDKTPVSESTRIALIRKGNELFNSGDVEKAKRIFLTVGYTDGITRVGDYYYQKRQPLEAYRMYWIAPAPDKVRTMTEKMASIVSGWLLDKGKTEP